MLELTTTGSHSYVGIQTIGEVRHRLVDVAVAALLIRSAGRLSSHQSS